MTSTPIPKTIRLTSHADSRGEFIEILKGTNVPKIRFGQLSITTIEPRQQKGDHYHKIRWEWFFVTEGLVEIDLIHIKTKKKKHFTTVPHKPLLICIPPYWNHVLINKGSNKAIALVYSSIQYMKHKPDVYYLEK